MPQFPHFTFDQISFWIGFIVSTLVWWVLLRLRTWFPAIKTYFKSLSEQNKRRKLAGVSYDIRQAVLRQAQKNHLAGSLFPLDEIVIPPRLIPPPQTIDPTQNSKPYTIADQIIPFLPDWPELSANYPITTLSPGDCLGNGANLAIIGQPGAGKSVALAFLASQFSRQDPKLGSLSELTPLYFHILDINIQDYKEDDDPTELLSQSVSLQSPNLSKKLPKALIQLLEEGRAILLLDGLDELPQAQIQLVVTYLKSLISKYPKIRIVVTASCEYLDGLISLKLIPVGIAAWNSMEHSQFINNWGEKWRKYIEPEIQKRYSLNELDHKIISSWLFADNRVLNPFELTLTVWTTYSGSTCNLNLTSVLDDYIFRLTNRTISREALEKLALEFCKYGDCSLTYKQIEHLLKMSSSQAAIRGLLENGFFAEHFGEKIRFNHPIFTGFLAGNAASNEDECSDLMNHDFWLIKIIASQYLLASGKGANYLSNIIKSDDLLCRKVLLASRSLNKISGPSEWRSLLMRQILLLINQDKFLISTKFGLLSAFIVSNDPSIAVLFRQFLHSNLDSIRTMGALGSGAIKDNKAVTDLLKLIQDPIPSVQSAACLALSTLESSIAAQAVAESLLSGEEKSIAAAESLACKKPEGHEILKSESASYDLLIRRAVVSGLSRVKEDWSIKILEKIAIEDGQWIVRVAASQGLELLKNPSLFAPTVLLPPEQAEWLCSFASKQGMGISTEEGLKSVLLKALRIGTPDEQAGALGYLQTRIDKDVYDSIVQYYQNGIENLQPTAYLGLRFLSWAGWEIPPN